MRKSNCATRRSFLATSAVGEIKCYRVLRVAEDVDPYNQEGANIGGSSKHTTTDFG